MGKTYKKPRIEKVERLVLPGLDKEDDIEAEYTCSGTGWNSGVSRKCPGGVNDE